MEFDTAADRLAELCLLKVSNDTIRRVSEQEWKAAGTDRCLIRVVICQSAHHNRKRGVGSSAVIPRRTIDLIRSAG
jgi:hypothetical protein